MLARCGSNNAIPGIAVQDVRMENTVDCDEIINTGMYIQHNRQSLFKK